MKSDQAGRQGHNTTSEHSHLPGRRKPGVGHSWQGKAARARAARAARHVRVSRLSPVVLSFWKSQGVRCYIQVRLLGRGCGGRQVLNGERRGPGAEGIENMHGMVVGTLNIGRKEGRKGDMENRRDPPVPPVHSHYLPPLSHTLPLPLPPLPSLDVVGYYWLLLLLLFFFFIMSELS